MKRLLILLVSLGLISVIAQAQQLIRVPQDKPTIQAAINIARVGDTVLVEEGLYYENVRINKNIVLASRFILDRDTAHISRTIIDGSKPRDEQRASVVTIIGPTDTTCEVIGFTIRGGSGTYRYYTNTTFPPRVMSGGGIILQQAGARIAHNIVTKNFLKGRPWAPDAEGAGIVASDTTIGLNIPSYVIIEYNTVIGNEASGQSAEGGGIELYQPGIIRHNIVTHNKAFSRTRSFAGGIYVGMTAEFDVVVDGNYIAHNVAGIGGGMLVTALYTRHGRAIITNNIIAENRAFEVGGAANVAEQTYAIFLNNTIVANRALSTGGGINVTEGSHVVLVNNILWGNKADQVSEWGIVQAIQNDVEGGLVGKGNFNADPRFIPGDTLFRLDPNSPCIGAGMKYLRLADRPFLIPGRDLSGSPRIAPVGSNPDMGATESPWGDEGQENQGIGSDGYLKFTVMFKQITEVLRNKETGEIIKAGEMLTTLVVNDSTRMVLDSTTAAVPFILSPGNNLLAVEVVTRARDSSAGLNAFIWLEGTDRRVSVLYRRHGLRYQHYSELRPGEYTLVVQPQDESSIIGHTNRVSVTVVVPPFWYQRWWAYSSYAFAVLSIAFVVYRVRMKRLRLEYETSRLAELDRMKSRFFANLSHEFRTPLSLILGPADQLETSERESARKEQLGLIRRNAERLLRMVNMLLQFARVESGALKLQVSLQPIPHFVRRVVSSFSTAAVKKGIALHADIEPASFEGYIDAEKVEHVLENLLSNALKYTSSGGRVDIRARRLGTELVLEVRDTGLGISPEHLSHVFERFYRVDSSHQYEGTGIGLSLSKELVDLHHGTFELKSSVGVGTVATVRLPLSGYQEHEIVKAGASRREERPGISEHVRVSEEIPGAENVDKTVVLVAEDNDDAREYLRSRLHPEFDVIEAVNGVQAWETASQRIPDVVVSDVMMPEMSGYELCAKLKQDERTSHIPVILLTALADQTDKIEGLQTGADDYLVKPFDAQELLVRVRNILANRKKIQERFITSVPLKPGDVKVESMEDKFLVKVMTVVEKQMGNEQFGVEQFAHEAHLSRAQLHRKLKALTNLSPTDFIRYIRLQRAKNLLEKNAGTVSEVAYQVGFSNHSYFAKCFKEQFGNLPSEVSRH